MRGTRCIYCKRTHANMLDTKCEQCAKEFKEIKENLYKKEHKEVLYTNNIIPFRMENRK